MPLVRKMTPNNKIDFIKEMRDLANNDFPVHNGAPSALSLAAAKKVADVIFDYVADDRALSNLTPAQRIVVIQRALTYGGLALNFFEWRDE